MFQKIRDFFSNSFVQWGIVLASIAGAAAYFFKVNDTSRPPVPDPEKSHDFSKEIGKLDPKKPIGIFVYNEKYDDGIGMKLTANTARNNLIEEMQKYYGANMIVMDNPSTLHFENFSRQFNEQFAAAKPPVHFVGNYHTKHPITEDTYNKKVAAFIGSIESDKKRALILSCGPESKLYKNTGCEYVIIPRPDSEVLPLVLHGMEWMPAYKEAIGWMAENKDPEVIRKKLAENNFGNLFQSAIDRSYTLAKDVYKGHPIEAHKPPLVLVPPTTPATSTKPHHSTMETPGFK